MAVSSSTRASALGNPQSAFPTGPVPVPNGVVQHVLVTAGAQVHVLSIVDETGSAEIGDIAAEMVGHPDPCGTIIALVEAGILNLELKDDILDARAIVRRAGPPDPFDPRPPAPVAPALPVPAPQPDVEIIDPTFRLTMVFANGKDRRKLGRVAGLDRPGVYILMNADEAYVGMGSDVGSRIAGGQQPISNVERVVVVTDASGALTVADAMALERMVHARIEAAGERELANSLTPGGAPIAPERYACLDAALGAICLELRHREVLFVAGTGRSVLAGPRAETGRLAPARLRGEPPVGDVMELTFGPGLVALVARQSEDRRTVLKGSDVRVHSVRSASAASSFLRAAWLHAGLIQPDEARRAYTVMRDLVFGSASAAAHFVVGSKAYGRSGWMPIEPAFADEPGPKAI